MKKIIRKLTVLANDFAEKYAAENKDGYGGKGSFELPNDHKAGVVVPKGGSCCANCEYMEMRKDGPHCTSTYWIKWNGGESRLPVDDPETYCSDFWEPKSITSD